jgi:Muconolactone delta-isomerase
MDFLVEFEVDVPVGTSETEVEDRERAEAVAATKLADEGHLLRVWKRPLDRQPRPTWSSRWGSPAPRSPPPWRKSGRARPCSASGS